MFISQFNTKVNSTAPEGIAVEKQALSRDIAAMAELENNWDGYGAIAVLPASIAHAEAIVENEAISVDKVEDVLPNPNGTITIVWGNGKDQVCLEVGVEKMKSWQVLLEVIRDMRI